VSPDADDRAVVHDDDLVGVDDRPDALGDDDHRRVAKLAIEGESVNQGTFVGTSPGDPIVVDDATPPTSPPPRIFSASNSCSRRTPVHASNATTRPRGGMSRANASDRRANANGRRASASGRPAKT